MHFIPRHIQHVLERTLARGKSVLLLGARQTGKTTLLMELPGDIRISMIRPDIRQRYEKNPAILLGEIEEWRVSKTKSAPLVLLDEVQKVPALLDVVQDCIDRKLAKFVLSGSSARKLRRGPHANLLPGRVVALRLDPMVYSEFAMNSIHQILIHGTLPGIATVQNTTNRELDLHSYVTTYLEEEVRAEALVRQLGNFARFLELAASESGKIVNTQKLSQEIGISHTTIRDYYQILEDCLIAERIEPLTKSKTRKKLTKSPRYLFFDLGVRRVAAKEGTQLPRSTLGELFEQYVGLELLRCARLSQKNISIRFWRDPDGPEVDWVMERDGEYIPFEVKMTDTPDVRDAKHLKIFLDEYPAAQKGYIVCTTPRPVKIAPSITAIPWETVDSLLIHR